LIDKILSIFGLVRCLEYEGELYLYDGYDLYFTFEIPMYIKYTNWSYGSACIAMGAKSRVVSINSLTLHQAMRCL
jgi:hypothetical protein